MNIVELVFWWRRDQREARQEARETERFGWESRQELHRLLAQSVAICEKRISLKPDDPRLTEEMSQRLALQAQILDRDIGVHPKLPLLEGPMYLLPEIEKDQERTLVRFGEIGEQLLSSRQYSAALEVLTLVDQLSPSFDSETARLKADALEKLGRIDEALLEVDRLLEHGDSARGEKSRKCFLLLKANRAEEAVILAETMLAEREDQRAFGTLAVLAMLQGQYKRAVQLLSEALSRWPNDAILLRAQVMAMTSGGLGNPTEFALHLLDVSPQEPVALQSLAASSLDNESPQDAIGYASRLIHEEPQNVEGHILLAQALQELGDHRGSLVQTHIAKDLAPQDVRIPLLELGAYGRMEGAEDAETFMQIISACTSMILNPNTQSELRASAFLIRGMWLAGFGAEELADSDFRTALQGELPKPVWEAAVRHLPRIPEVLQWPEEPK